MNELKNYVRFIDENGEAKKLKNYQYGSVYWRFLGDDFYLSINNVRKEQVKEILASLPFLFPVVLINSEEYINNPHFIYRYTSYVYADNIYQSILNDSLYLKKEDKPIIFFYADYESYEELARIRNYLEIFYPDNEIKYQVNVDSLESLNKVSIFLNMFSPKSLIINLDNQFFQNIKNSKSIKNLNWPSDVVIRYQESYYHSMQEIIELEKDINIIINRIPNNAQALDKIVFVSLFLIDYFSYDDYSTDCIKNSYELFKDQLGVCRDFAKLFLILMSRLNIECQKIYAPSKIDSEQGHVFNVVTLNGQTSYIDLTYLIDEIKNGLITSIAESYNFLTSSANFAKLHQDLIYDVHHCQTVNRKEIEGAIIRVRKWYFARNIDLQTIFHPRFENRAKIKASLPRLMRKKSFV